MFGSFEGVEMCRGFFLDYLGGSGRVRSRIREF